MSVRILTTGGTIASRPASDGSVSVAISGTELIHAVPVQEILRKHSFAAGLPVVVTSRCAAGSTAPIYGAGGGADLAATGARMAGALPSSKARILLSLALATSSVDCLDAHITQDASTG